MNHELRKKKIPIFLVTALFVISVSFSPFAAKKAHALFGFSITFDPSNFGQNTITAVNSVALFIKEHFLDPAAWSLVANTAIERLTAETVNWINSGFKGSPSFATNPEQYFRKLGDQVAGQIIYNHPDLQFMCSPFRLQVQFALNQNYLNPYGNYQCSLSQIENNFEGFMGDFYQGGWDGFIQVTQNSQNNPLGLYNMLNNELNATIANKTLIKQQELDWAQGFLSIKKCPDGMMVTDSPEDAQYRDNFYNVGDCLVEEETVTPGAVIETQLNDVLGLPAGRLQVADEISEILSALLNQVMSRALGGLFSLGKPDPTDPLGQNRSFLQQLASGTDYTIEEQGIEDDINEIWDNYDRITAEGQRCASLIGTGAISPEGTPVDTSSYSCFGGTSINVPPAEGGEGGTQPDYIIIIDGRTIDCRAPQTEPDYFACINAGKI